MTRAAGANRVESDAEPVADFIADGAAVSAVYSQLQGVPARHDHPRIRAIGGDNKLQILRTRRGFPSHLPTDSDRELTIGAVGANDKSGLLRGRLEPWKPAGQVRQAT